MTKPSPFQLFLPTLFTAWEASGHTIDIHRHLQLKQLMDKLPENLEIKDLKTIIAPILADDAQTQEAFYEVFDQTAAIFQKRYEKHKDWVEPLQNNVNKRSINSKQTARNNTGQNIENGFIRFFQKYLITSVISVAFTFIMVMVSLFQWLTEDKETNPIVFPTQKVYVKANLDIPETQKFCLSGYGTVDEVEITPLNNDELEFIEIEADYYKNLSFCLEYKALKRGREVIRYSFCKKDKLDCAIVEFTFDVNHYGKKQEPIVNVSEGDLKFKKKNTPLGQLDAQANLLDTSFLSCAC